MILDDGSETLVGSHPAATEARDEDFGKGVEANDATIRVKGEERGDVGEGNGRLGELGRGRVKGRELEVVVGIVLDEDEIEALSEGVDRLAASEGHGYTRRVLACRNLE